MYEVEERFRGKTNRFVYCTKFRERLAVLKPLRDAMAEAIEKMDFDEMKRLASEIKKEHRGHSSDMAFFYDILNPR